MKHFWEVVRNIMQCLMWPLNNLFVLFMVLVAPWLFAYILIKWLESL